MKHWIICALLGLAAGGPAVAQDGGTHKVPVHFAAGATGATLKGEIRGRESVSYTVGAQAGQKITVRLKSASDALYFNLYGPGRGPGDEALAVSEMAGTEMVPEMNLVSGVLPASGTYTVNVFLYRAAARRGEHAAFTLDVSVSALGSAAAPVQGDYADGLEGGPDYFRVDTSGGPLALRAGPGVAAASIGRLEPRATVRNLGCRMSEGRRWCHVATLADPGLEGWAAGDFLVEGAPPEAGDTLVPGTDFHATGMVTCALGGAPTGTCKFGVRREAPGRGTITLFGPEGGMRRVIGYENDRPAWSDASQADGEMRVAQHGDIFVVTIGEDRFELVEAIMTGG